MYTLDYTDANFLRIFRFSNHIYSELHKSYNVYSHLQREREREILFIISPNSGFSKILEYILGILYVTDLAERFMVFMDRRIYS